MNSTRWVNVVLPFMLLFLSSCLSDGDKITECGERETFDSVSRSCVKTLGAVAPPLDNRFRIIDEDIPGTVDLEFSGGGRFDSCEILPGSPTPNLTRTSPLMPPQCRCGSSGCSVDIFPLENAYGPGSLFYRLHDPNEGYTEYRQLSVFIRDRNDTPVLSPLSFTMTVNEDGDSNSPQNSRTTAATLSFNLCRELTGLTLTDDDSVRDVAIQIVTPPSQGSLSCNGCNCGGDSASCRCDYTFAGPNDNGAGYATFGFRFEDFSPYSGDAPRQTQTATVTLDVTAVNDRPASMGTVDLRGTPLTEDTPGVLTLPPLGDSESAVVTYEIATTANCGVGGEVCLHTLENLWRNYGAISNCLNLDNVGGTTTPGRDLTCDFHPHLNEHAESLSFYYRAIDSTGIVGDWTEVMFRLEGVNDPPIAFFGLYQTRESATARAVDERTTPFDFASMVGEGIDPDSADLSSPSATIESYSFVSQPSEASFQNCMNNDRDLTCDFVIDGDDGNFSTDTNTPAVAQATLSGLTISARHAGSAGNLITVNLLAESTSVASRVHPIPSDYSSTCPAGGYAVCKEYYNRMVQVGSDGRGMLAINVRLQATNYTTTDADVENLLNNHPMASGFVRASGSSGSAAVAGTVPLTGGLDGDSSIRAFYSISDGSIVNEAPHGIISITVTPTDDKAVFCRYSSYREAPECGLPGCLGIRSPEDKGIVPLSHTRARPLYYYDFSTSLCYRSNGVNPGNWEIAVYSCPYSRNHRDCGGRDCRADGSPVGTVTPSSHTASLPLIYQDRVSMACYRSTGTAVRDWKLISASLPEIEVNEGEIIRPGRIIFDEGGADTAEDSQRIFLSRFFSSNETLIDLDAVEVRERINRRFFPCPFSPAACDGGVPCHESQTSFSNPIGNVTPTNHTRVNPLYYWANETDSLKCYRSTGTASSDWVEVIDNTVAYTENVYSPVDDSFSLAGGGRLALGNTTGSEDDDVFEIVLSPTKGENGSALISFNLDDGGCRFTYNCGGGPCQGTVSPVGVATPSNHSSASPVVYKDTLSGSCYVSTGTAATNWKQVDAWPVTPVYFKVTVRPVGVRHGGWKYLRAKGPNVNKYNEVISKDIVSCPWSRSSCNGGRPCRGAGNPGTEAFSPPTVSADMDYAIYHDTSGGSCYFWNSGLAQTNKWQAFTNRCSLTGREYAPECYNGSCLFNTTRTTPSTIVPTRLGHSYAFYDSSLDKFTCYRSYGLGAGEVESYKAPGSVEISWENFIVGGGGDLQGYFVYRHHGHTRELFDDIRPLNEVPLAVHSNHFVDNSSNSFSPPLPGTVYHYEVRPIIDGIETKSIGSYTTPRIFVPKSNMAFVHRRIVNKRMCRLMGKTDIDPSNHNSCLYTGLGDNVVGRYDIGQDFHVATFEAACPYTVGKNSCTTGDGNCIADRTPTSGDGDNGDFFYNRGSGLCYWKNTTTGNWGEIEGEMASLVAAYGGSDANLKEILKPQRPPLASLPQSGATSLCTDDSMEQGGMLVGCAFSFSGCDTANSKCVGTTDPIGTGGNVTAGAAGLYFWNASKRTCWKSNSTTAGDWSLAGGRDGLSMMVPTRKQQVAFSLWDEDLSPSSIFALEQGTSLQNNSRCNSSRASGLIAGYTDTESIQSYNLYALSGTRSSGIRSMVTGSRETEECRSLFGIRDMIGNMTEWSRDRVRCTLPYSCTFDSTTNSDFSVQSSAASRLDGNGGFSFGWYNGDRDQLIEDWDVDGYPVGPCQDSDNDSICDGLFDSWIIGERHFGASRFIVPLGLPAHGEFSNNYRNDSAQASLLEIGPASGITARDLHGDTVVVGSAVAYCPYNKDHSDCSNTDCTTTATGEGTPWGNITPSGHTAAEPLYFFNDNNHQCYRSNGVTSSSWQLVSCNYNDSGSSLPTPSDHEDDNPLIFYNSSTNTCSVSTGTSAGNWRDYGPSDRVNAPFAGVASGGGYQSGSGAGQFHLEFIDFRSARDRHDVGFRCVMPIDNSFYLP